MATMADNEAVKSKKMKVTGINMRLISPSISPLSVK